VVERSERRFKYACVPDGDVALGVAAPHSIVYPQEALNAAEWFAIRGWHLATIDSHIESKSKRACPPAITVSRGF
jgi:hypothetical protein